MAATSRRAKLADLVTLNPRLAKPLGSEDLVSFVPMAAVDADTASISTTDVRRYTDVSKGYTTFEDGDILVAKITPCFENGKIAQVKVAHSPGFGSTEFHVLRPRSDELDSRYLLHYLRQARVRHDGQRKMTGSAGQRRVPPHFFENLYLPLPPIKEQRRIAVALDQVEELRGKCREAFVQLNDLAQSIFIFMFGDPAFNPMHWERQTVGELAQKYSDGPFGSNLKSSHYVSSGVRVIRLQNIGVGTFVDDDAAYISPGHFSRLIKHKCLPGDVLIGTLGEPNLRACIQPASIQIALNKADCVQLRPNPRKAVATYVCALLNQPSMERMASGLVLGQTRARISMGRLRGLLVPVPPLDLQREFTQRVETVDRIKASYRAQLAELDALFASLQYRAFRGDL